MALGLAAFGDTAMKKMCDTMIVTTLYGPVPGAHKLPGKHFYHRLDDRLERADSIARLLAAELEAGVFDKIVIYDAPNIKERLEEIGVPFETL